MNKFIHGQNLTVRSINIASQNNMLAKTVLLKLQIPACSGNKQG